MKDEFQSHEKENNISRNLDSKVENKHSHNQQYNNDEDSLLSIFSLGDGSNCDATLAKNLEAQKRKKKREVRR